MCPVRLMVVDRVMYSWVCNAGPKCLGCTDFSILKSIFDRSVYDMITSLDCDPYCSRKVLSSTLRQYMGLGVEEQMVRNAIWLKWLEAALAFHHTLLFSTTHTHTHTHTHDTRADTEI